jgi:hypothetical protein
MTGILFPQRGKDFFFSSPPHPDRLWGPPSHLSNSYRGLLSPEMKRQGREADHSPPSSGEVKNAWSCASPPPYVFMACFLFKHKENFTLTLIM